MKETAFQSRRILVLPLRRKEHATGSRVGWQAGMPASTVTARFQCASDGGILPPIAMKAPRSRTRTKMEIKKPRHCRARHDPLNMFYNMRNPPGCFRLPVKACRPQSQVGSIDRFTTVQGIAADHEQSRVNQIKLPKEQHVVFNSRFMTIKSPQTGIFSSRIFGEISGGALDKCEKRFSKKLHCPPDFAGIEPPVAVPAHFPAIPPPPSPRPGFLFPGVATGGQGVPVSASRQTPPAPRAGPRG